MFIYKGICVDRNISHLPVLEGYALEFAFLNLIHCEGISMSKSIYYPINFKSSIEQMFYNLTQALFLEL